MIAHVDITMQVLSCTGYGSVPRLCLTGNIRIYLGKVMKVTCALVSTQGRSELKIPTSYVLSPPTCFEIAFVLEREHERDNKSNLSFFLCA